jgi:hypothetical protein
MNVKFVDDLDGSDAGCHSGSTTGLIKKKSS